MKKKFLSVFSATVLLLTGFTGCSSSENASEEDEEIVYHTLSVADPDYYSRFKGKDISINVYNWGEYISTGADEGTLSV